MYPKNETLVKAFINWGRSRLNGEHKGRYIGKAFRARSGAILHPFMCQTHGKKEYHPWTSDNNIIKWESV